MSLTNIDTALYTAAQVRALDSAAIAEGVSGYVLMQRAAIAAFDALKKHWPHAQRIGILAGSGNNGGDAFLVGQLAHAAGYDVIAIALTAESTGDAVQARQAYLDAGGHVDVFIEQHSLPSVDLWVDGLFGTGLSRAPEKNGVGLIELVNATQIPVFALDVPSGLLADTGMASGAAIKAAVTISFVAWKRGVFTADGPDCCGTLALETLDIATTIYDAMVPDAVLLETKSLSRLLPKRKKNVNKGSFGHVLTIGGDYGMAGAVRLASEAALRVGAGLVTVATHAEHVSAFNAARPELMVHAIEGPQALLPLLERASVIVLGPGLGQRAWGCGLMDIALRCNKPLVLDADALNGLAPYIDLLPATAVLTPHPGEAARLLNITTHEVQNDRFAAARAIATRFNAVVVLKGNGSLIAHPSGQVAICPWGNPGMASGGMGDVLSGVIAGLLAQGLNAWEAACLGVGLHAKAGDIAAGAAPRGILASDLFKPLQRLANDFYYDE